MFKKITIEINADNSAFEENPNEVSRILRKIADQLEKGQEPSNPMDFNGNSVGKIEYN